MEKVTIPAIIILLIVSLALIVYFYSNSVQVEQNNQLLKSQIDSQNQAISNYGTAIQSYSNGVIYEETGIQSFGYLIAKMSDSKFDDAITTLPQIRNSFDESKLQFDKSLKLLPNNPTLVSDLENFNNSRTLLLNGIEKILNISTNQKYNSNKMSKTDIEEFISDLQKVKTDFTTAKENVDKIQNREYFNVLLLKNYYDSINAFIDKTIVVLENMTPIENQPGIPSTSEKLNLTRLSLHWLGNDNSKVTMIEFGGFQDPFTANFNTNTFKQLKYDYIDSGKVYFGFAHFPLSFHPQAYSSANAAECAGEQGKFWQIFDILLQNQSELGTSFYKSYAQQINLDISQFNTCFDTKKYNDLIQKDYDEGILAGIGGSPTFVIIKGDTQKIIVGTQPYQTFENAINEFLNN